ncbi:MAG: glycoside hydrolase family 55 protein, partial [Planctomycetes bacterium]|nr:glycoside hydrolase family 55 protein [Planctomycetota bacterium]
MRRGLFVLAVLMLFCNEASAELPREFDRSDRLFRLGLLDVTQAPYSADPAGQVDSTEVIQRAVNDARDNGLVCFFPDGTYLISDTISCEQEVSKLATPKHVDGGTQHYWPVHRPIVLLGSSRGKRPVLKLSKDAQGFDNPTRPKLAVHIWAQTWFDARGKEEPIWGEEQPNISFDHIFKGIDIDISGHPGAIGIRHSGSQGSTMQDITIHAEGAYAGMSNCCGQGGGTYNIEVMGGRYGIVIEPNSRFPILTACQVTGQDAAAIRYAKGGSQVPTLLVGCRLAPNSDAAIDMTTERSNAGVSMVDCIIDLTREGSVFTTGKPENVFLEDTFVRGVDSIVSQGTPIAPAAVWTHVRRFSTHAIRGVTLINGEVSADRIALCEKAQDAPSFEELAARHYERTPSFEDDDAVSVKDFGAKGDGTTADTEAFRKAIAMSDKVFLPSGDYALSGTLGLRRNTHLFGFSRSFTS